jgi:hypothetical protein
VRSIKSKIIRQRHALLERGVVVWEDLHNTTEPEGPEGGIRLARLV